MATEERERQSSPASGFLVQEMGWMVLAVTEIEITGPQAGRWGKMSFGDMLSLSPCETFKGNEDLVTYSDWSQGDIGCRKNTGFIHLGEWTGSPSERVKWTENRPSPEGNTGWISRRREGPNTDTKE